MLQRAYNQEAGRQADVVFWNDRFSFYSWCAGSWISTYPWNAWGLMNEVVAEAGLYSWSGKVCVPVSVIAEPSARKTESGSCSRRKENSFPKTCPKSTSTDWSSVGYTCQRGWVTEYSSVFCSLTFVYPQCCEVRKLSTESSSMSRSWFCDLIWMLFQLFFFQL